MLRVLATIRQSEFANTLKPEQNNLSAWVQEIHVGIYPHLNSNNLFTNYADQPVTAPGNFYDASSTAILASTVYRAAVMLNQLEFIPLAEKTRQTLISTSSNQTLSDSSSSFDGYNYLTSDGWLTPVVDPYDYPTQGQNSPEGEAFVVEMQSAWRDWVESASNGAACTIRLGPEVLWTWAGVGTVSMLMMVGAVTI